MDYKEKDNGEILTLNDQKKLDNPEQYELDEKTSAQRRHEFDESIKFDATSGDYIIDLGPFKTSYSEEYNQEMTVLKRIVKCEKLHDLIDHPIPKIFLNLKWAKAANVFYLNLLILSVFIVSMIGYMICYHSLVNDELREMSAGLAFWKWMCKISIVYLMTRELCQFYLNFQGHLRVLNIIEIVLIIYGLQAFFLPEISDMKSRKAPHVILILLCTYELLHILSKTRLLSMSMYIAIFNRALHTLLKVLFLYSIVLVAFAVSFHILFVRHDRVLQEHEYFQNYQTFIVSLLRVVLMMIGDYEADKRKLNVSTMILMFLFTIVCLIILLNLLKALTISDTQEIINVGKRFEHIQRVKILHFYEKCKRNLINREKFLFCSIPKWVKRFERWLGQAIYSRVFSIWSQLSNSDTMIIRTTRNNQILVVDGMGMEQVLLEPHFALYKLLPSFVRNLSEFNDMTFEYETASEEIVNAIDAILRNQLEESKEVTIKKLFDEIRVLKVEFDQMETNGKVFYGKLQKKILLLLNVIPTR